MREVCIIINCYFSNDMIPSKDIAQWLRDVINKDKGKITAEMSEINIQVDTAYIDEG